MDKRQVKLATLFTLVRRRGPLATIGLIFMLISVFILFPIIIIINLVGKQPYQDYNYNDIEAKGIELPAKVSGIKILYNQTYNGYHPQVISYTYQNNGRPASDKFETIEDIQGLKDGDTIKIKVLNGESKIKGLESFSFPFGIFFIIPGIFFSIGLIFLLIVSVPAWKLYNLYRKGIVKDAVIVEIHNYARGVINFRKDLLVNYYYTGSHGNKVFGSSLTDMTILMEKQLNDTIKIFVSEDDETKSCMVPKLEALKNNWVI